jgi:hypothetical protein
MKGRPRREGEKLIFSATFSVDGALLEDERDGDQQAACMMGRGSS